MKDIRAKLMEITGKSEQECETINEILNKRFIIGHNNKGKIMSDFMEQLNLTKEDADNLYNQCSEIIVKGIFNK